MPLWTNFLILFASLLILAKSAELVVKNLIKIANILRLSTFIVSFVILGIATSTPELFVGINSVAENSPQLSLGNVMGATIVLLSLITGLTALITGKVVVDATFTKRDLFIMNVVILMPIILLYDGSISRLDSFIIFLTYGIYVIRMYQERHKLSHPIANHNNKSQIIKSVVMLVIGFLGLAYASNFAVDTAIEVATTLKIPVLLLGILLFSIGTNFPELVIALTAIRKKQKTIVLGNVMGSATSNSLVIAIVSFLQPFEVLDFNTFLVSVFFLVTTIVSFSFFVKSKNEISRLEGIFLLSIYSFFVISEIITKLL
jgi:cation:H+ antiporter